MLNLVVVIDKWHTVDVYCVQQIVQSESISVAIKRKYLNVVNSSLPMINVCSGLCLMNLQVTWM